MVRRCAGIPAIQVGNRIEQFRISRCGAGYEPGIGKSFPERSRCVHVRKASRKAFGKWIGFTYCELLVLNARLEVAVAAGTASYVLHHCGFRNFHFTTHDSV